MHKNKGNEEGYLSTVSAGVPVNMTTNDSDHRRQKMDKTQTQRRAGDTFDIPLMLIRHAQKNRRNRQSIAAVQGA